ncbi:hypothetical protein V6Z11_D10G200900 [Gossypium hirsutum]
MSIFLCVDQCHNMILNNSDCVCGEKREIRNPPVN